MNRVLEEVRRYEAGPQGGFPDAWATRFADTAAHCCGCRAGMRDGRTGYPDNRGEPALRQAVAEKLLREQGLSYDPASEILITDGATLPGHRFCGDPGAGR